MKNIMRTTLVLAVLVLAVALAGGCGGTKNVATLGNFTMNFSGFTPHIGSMFYLKLVDTTAGSTVALATPAAITADAFSVTFPNIVVSGHTYNVDFWVDTDANGTLDHSPNGTPVGVDHSWRVTGAGTDTGLALNFAHNTSWVDITPY